MTMGSSISRDRRTRGRGQRLFLRLSFSKVAGLDCLSGARLRVKHAMIRLRGLFIARVSLVRSSCPRHLHTAGHKDVQGVTPREHLQQVCLIGF